MQPRPSLNPVGLTRRSFCAALLMASGGLPRVRAANAGKPVHVFNGTDLSGWQAPTGDWLVCRAVHLDSTDPKRFTSQPGRGVMLNGDKGRTVNLLSRFEHGDVEAHIEFCIPKGSNSGVYFMGRYEVQIYDSYGVVKDKYPGIECGGVYPRWAENREYEGHSPRVNASRPPGEWQTFDVTFRAPTFDTAGRKLKPARFVRVIHNGKLIHENVTVTGPTRAARFENDEKAAGPLMLQGDHGPVAYRNIRLTPLNPE